MFNISEPPVKFLSRHCKNLTGEFAETICKRIHDEEVGRLSAVD
jgi:hypothetical protein